jgi:hypothetical protein
MLKYIFKIAKGNSLGKKNVQRMNALLIVESMFFFFSILD